VIGDVMESLRSLEILWELNTPLVSLLASCNKLVAGWRSACDCRVIRSIRGLEELINSAKGHSRGRSFG